MSQPPIKVLIVDDEPLARRRIRSLLAAHTDMEVMAECANGLEALNYIRESSPDLVFLDVQMPEIDGIKLIDSVDPARAPLFIFVTAHPKHGISAFEADAVDFLLKPFDQGRFDRSITKARNRLVVSVNGRPVEGQGTTDPPEQEARCIKQIAIRSGGSIFPIKVEAIDWIEAERNYVRLHAGENCYLRREAIGSFESRLDPKQFRRIHRSVIVNLERIRELRATEGGEYQVILQDGRTLYLSHTYHKNLAELLD